MVNQLIEQLAPRAATGQGTPRQAKVRLLVAGIAGVTLCFGGVLASLLFRATPSAPPPMPAFEVPVGLPPPVAKALRREGKPKLQVPMGPENFYWLDQYISPVGVDANGDGIEDVAGGFILFENNSLNAYVGVVDGKTFEILWKHGPYGDRAKATRSTGVAVKEGRLLAVNVLGDARVFDLTTGEELLTFPFDEENPARYICAPEGGPDVYLGNGWSTGQLLNLKTLKLQKARAPKECAADTRRPADTGDVADRQARNETRSAPKLERFDATCWFHDGVHGVMMGTARGSDLVELVGFDPVKRVETWRQPVAAIAPAAVGRKPQALDLANGLFFFTWGEDGEHHVAAVDVKTGSKRWDAVSPGARPANVTVSKERLYLVTLEWDAMPVNVFDLKSGVLIARLGGTGSRY